MGREDWLNSDEEQGDNLALEKKKPGINSPLPYKMPKNKTLSMEKPEEINTQIIANKVQPDTELEKLKAKLEALKNDLDTDLKALKEQTWIVNNLADLAICPECGITFSLRVSFKDDSESPGLIQLLSDVKYFQCPVCKNEIAKITSLTGQLIQAQGFALDFENIEQDKGEGED